MRKCTKNYVIQWRNRFSQETGFVEKVSKRQKCFFNTSEQENALRLSKESAKAMINFLNTDTKECENNDFFAVCIA